MIKIRMHRGDLELSMNTMKECRTKWDAFDYLINNGVMLSTCTCEMYMKDGANRIGWGQVWIVRGRYEIDPIPNVIYPVAFSDVYIDFIS
jgi:hypothetical protein